MLAKCPLRIQRGQAGLFQYDSSWIFGQIEGEVSPSHLARLYSNIPLKQRQLIALERDQQQRSLRHSLLPQLKPSSMGMKYSWQPSKENVNATTAMRFALRPTPEISLEKTSILTRQGNQRWKRHHLHNLRLTSSNKRFPPSGSSRLQLERCQRLQNASEDEVHAHFFPQCLYS